MSTPRSKSILIMAGLLVFLALLSGTSTLTSQLTARTRQPGTFNGQPGNPQGNNNRNFQGGNGNNRNLPGGNNGVFQSRGGFNLFTLFRSTGLNPQAFGYINLGLTISGILLALLSAFGLWKQKKWGLNLGMLIALLFLLGAIPGLFTLGARNINWLRTVITVLTLVASAPILVMASCLRCEIRSRSFLAPSCQGCSRRQD
jgi:uncharacterized membrane protein (DUF2068 family)